MKLNKNKARGFKQVRNRRRRGVSPVIGVILMVAATIVIAAVVMTMLGGFKPATPPKTMGISASRINSTHVDFTITMIEPAGTTISYINATAGVESPLNTTEQTAIGEVWTVKTSGTPPVHVVLSATFGDGTTQAIYDSRV